MIEGVTVDYGGASVGYGARQKGSEEVNCRSSSIRRAAAEASHHIPNIQYRHRPTVVPTATSLFQILFRAGVILGGQKWVSFA